MGGNFPGRSFPDTLYSHFITNFTETEEKKRMISHFHIVLILHVYISIPMSVSNGWKSYSG